MQLPFVIEKENTGLDFISNRIQSCLQHSIHGAKFTKGFPNNYSNLASQFRELV